MLLDALSGKHAAARDIVALNAGASLYVAGRADSLEQGVEHARFLISTGAARQKLDALVGFTQSLR
jgi:anthranilate phosphoribosyltransferase